MSTRKEALLFNNEIFAWLAAGTTLLLLIPLIAMQLTDEVDWQAGDFLIMGITLLGISSSFGLVARKIPADRRVPTALILLQAFFWLWAELAVGIFTNLGS